MQAMHIFLSKELSEHYNLLNNFIKQIMLITRTSAYYIIISIHDFRMIKNTILQIFIFIVGFSQLW